MTAHWRKFDIMITTSKKLSAISLGAECLYYRAYVLTDDFGRFYADPRLLKGKTMALRKVSVSTVAKWVEELFEIGLIKLYKNEDETYLEIVAFDKHQSFRKDVAKKAIYPKPTGYQHRTVSKRDGAEQTVDIRIEQNRIEQNRIEQNKKTSKTQSSCRNFSKDKKVADVVEHVDIKLTQLLMNLILKNDPKAKVTRMPESTQETWLNECRKLREIDKRTPDEIKFVIEWTQQDSFEKTNVLSMTKLRKRFSQLFMKAKRDKGYDKYVTGGNW